MKVYGALEAAQIEWFTNAGKPAASSYPFRVIYVTDLKQIQVSDGTNWNPSALYTYTAGTLPAAGASNQYQVAFITDTLQVKVSNGTEWKTVGARLDTYTSGTIPAAASNANSIIWVSDLQQVQVSNGTSWVQVGSKAGTKNYFSQNNANADFETNSVSPWSACTLTFSSGVPSGAPTLTATQMSIATTATTPLSGTYSMLLTKAAANAQYQGFISGALTIDREDTAKVLFGSFYYEVVSGTIDLSGSSTQSLEIWIYNTVSGQWTQPSGYRGMNQSSGVGKVVFSFQTDGTYANNAYRIAVITQQTSTSSYVVEFDDFQVGPQAIVLGSAMTDWQSYTPTFTGFGTAANINFKSRRVGDSLEVSGYFQAGTCTAVLAQITLGYAGANGNVNVDINKVASLAVIGSGASNTGASSTYFGNLTVLANGAVNYVTLGVQTSTTNALSPALVSSIILNNSYVSFYAKVPIQGWGSFSQVSSDTDTRVVDFRAAGLSSTTFTAGTALTFSTTSKDSHGAWTTNNTYKVPVSGDYLCSMMFYRTNLATTVQIYKNGSIYDVSSYLYVPNGTPASGAFLLPNLNAGDLITFVPSVSTTIVSAPDAQVSLFRLSGPSVITATETVAAFGETTSGLSIPNSSWTTVTTPTIVDSTHGALTTGGVFTAPISGRYFIAGVVNFSSNASGYRGIRIRKNSGDTGIGTLSPPVSGDFSSCTCSGYLKLNAGDTVIMQALQTSGGAILLTTSAALSSNISIVRVGN